MRDLKRDSPDRTIAFVSLKILLFAKSINATIHDVKTTANDLKKRDNRVFGKNRRLERQLKINQKETSKRNPEGAEQFTNHFSLVKQTY